MNKEQINVLAIDEVQARMKSISEEMDAEGANITALSEEVEMLQARKAAIEEEETVKAQMRKAIAEGTVASKVVEQKTEDVQNTSVMEERGRDLLQARTVTVADDDILLPQHQSAHINPTFNEVSTLVDKVGVTVVKGGESYKEPFLKGYGMGGLTAEGAEYTEAEPQFDYASINKVKITATADVTEELKKLPAADYASHVLNGISVAIRKKLSQQLIAGTGTDELMGITATPEAIDTAKDVEIAELGVDTLDDVIFAYGGEEDVEANQVLILNKGTLRALAKIRKENGDKAYDIDTRNQTIDTIPYIINSNVKSFEEASADDFVMLYGALPSYRVVQFSPVEIAQTNSDADKFKKGIDTFRGSVFVGGNVVSYNGFLRVKKNG